MNFGLTLHNSSFLQGVKRPHPGTLLNSRVYNWPNNYPTSNNDMIHFETQASVYTWPMLLPASRMDEGPMIITRYDRSAYPTRPISEQPFETRSWEKPRIPSTAHVRETMTFNPTHESPYLPGSSHSPLLVSPDADNYISENSSPASMTYLSSSLRRSYVISAVPALHTLTSNRSTSRTLNGEDGQGNVGESCPDTASDSIAWELHTRSTTSMAGEILYICEYGGKCGYSSTKQSVKRHVLGTHLKFKPHECPYCDKHFPTRTALSSHIATHTGELPLACRYKGCDKRYSDPARRHRHHINVHGYKPRKYKKKFRPPTDQSETDRWFS
ncbi:hypothetical protein E4T56_gene16051 [Termitomyces sp. T112]|nr:hypothetical protein E4T56_gene16051 [Termitomyces sp. T112]